MVHLPEDAPSPRLCIVEKSSPDQEYGYNLHAEKGRGQFVGVVDKGSPAELGGLRMGDRIFAVNGHNIIGESHKKVVERIKENALRCEMLVISEEGAQWYNERGIEINLKLPNIQRIGDDANRRNAKANGSPPPAAGWYAPSTKVTDPVFVAPPPPQEDPNMNKPRPRLCELEKSSPSEEFGFNLHAEKGRGHFIGTVDQGGIGDRAGLRMGQRIVGVNGVLVYPNTPHKEVVAQIKRSPLRTTLLVASENVDRWYKEHNAEYSFDYVEENVSNNKQLSLHSIHISDDDDLQPHQLNSQHQLSEDVDHIEVEEVHETDVAQQQEHGVELSQQDRQAHVSVVQTESEHTAVETSTSNDGIIDAVFSALPTLSKTQTPPEPLTKANELQHEELKVRDSSCTNSTHSLSHQNAVDVANYVPTYQSKLKNDEQTSSSPVLSNGYQSSSEGVSPVADKCDIFDLSAQEARERLRQNKKNIHRGFDMSLEEKYRLVSNM